MISKGMHSVYLYICLAAKNKKTHVRLRSRDLYDDGLGLKSYSKWVYIRLVTSHQWGSPGLNFKASALQCFHKLPECRSLMYIK